MFSNSYARSRGHANICDCKIYVIITMMITDCINNIELNDIFLHHCIYFNRFMRMSPDAFHHLVSVTQPYLVKRYWNRVPISPAHRLAITLRYLSSGMLRVPSVSTFILVIGAVYLVLTSNNLYMYVYIHIKLIMVSSSINNYQLNCV